VSGGGRPSNFSTIGIFTTWDRFVRSDDERQNSNYGIILNNEANTAISTNYSYRLNYENLSDQWKQMASDSFWA